MACHFLSLHSCRFFEVPFIFHREVLASAEVSVYQGTGYNANAPYHAEAVLLRKYQDQLADVKSVTFHSHNCSSTFKNAKCPNPLDRIALPTFPPMWLRKGLPHFIQRVVSETIDQEIWDVCPEGPAGQSLLIASHKKFLASSSSIINCIYDDPFCSLYIRPVVYVQLV